MIVWTKESFCWPIQKVESRKEMDTKASNHFHFSRSLILNALLLQRLLPPTLAARCWLLSLVWHSSSNLTWHPFGVPPSIPLGVPHSLPLGVLHLVPLGISPFMPRWSPHLIPFGDTICPLHWVCLCSFLTTLLLIYIFFPLVFVLDFPISFTMDFKEEQNEPIKLVHVCLAYGKLDQYLYQLL